MVVDMDNPDNLHVPLCSITYSTPDQTPLMYIVCTYDVYCMMYVV